MSVKRGEIYFVNLSPTKGREQAGDRPVLVISNDIINIIKSFRIKLLHYLIKIQITNNKYQIKSKYK